MKKQWIKSMAIAGAAMLAGNLAQAQFSAKVGPEAGFGVSGLTRSDNNTSNGYVGFTGQIGATADFQFGRWFAVRPSVFLQTRSFTNGSDYGGYSSSNDNITYTNNNLFMPVDLVFTNKTRSGGKFFVGLGPYFAYTFSGKYRETNQPTDNLNFGTGTDKDMEPLDIGLDFKLGYQLANNLFFNFSIDYGLSNRAPYSNYNAANVYDYSVQDFEFFHFGIGYLFGQQEHPAKKHGHGRGDHDTYRTYHRSYSY